MEPTKEILSLTKQLVELTERYEQAAKLKSTLYNEKERLEFTLSEKMKEIGLESFRTTEFGLIYTYNAFYARIIDIDAAKKYLEENGLFNEVLQLTPRKGRLNEIIKKLLEQGKPVPAGFDYSLSMNIGNRKG